MAIHRRDLPAAFAAMLFLSSTVASAEAGDVVPGAAHRIPSGKAEAIAPRYRSAPPYRIAQGAAEAGRPDSDRRKEPGVAVAPADTTEGASGPVADHGTVDAAKPGIPATEASVDGARAPSGEAKSDERLPADPAAFEADATTTGTGPEAAPSPQAEIEMVRVPAPIVSAARKALPGITFTSVDLSRSGPATVYGLSGKSDQGRAVSVAIDQAAKVMKVDRQARDAEIPAEIMTLANAVLPGARIGRTMLSLRPGFVAVYAFTGDTATGQPFVLDIRSDGRTLAFIDPE